MASSERNARNGVATHEKVRVAIIGVGNCANSLLQGVQYYKDAARGQFVPGLMHVNLGGYHVSRHRVHGRVRRHRGQGRQGPRRTRSGRIRTTRSSSPTCRRRASRSSRGMTHDGIGKYLSEVVEKAPGETDDVVGILQRDADRRRRQLPPGRLRGGDEVVRGADPRGRLRDGQLHAGVHRARARTGRSASRRRACRSSATTSSRRSARRSRTAC